MAGKSKRGAEADTGQLIEVMLSGGPRVSTAAYTELSKRVRDGHDVVSGLPAPEGLERVERHRIFSLLLSTSIRQKDGPRLLKLLDQQTETEVATSLLGWGNFIEDQALVGVLVDKLIELVRSDSAEVATHAAYALTQWCSRDLYQPWDSAVDFSAILADPRKSKAFPRGVGSMLVSGFDHAASRSERAPGVLAAWLAHENKEVRKVAAELQTRRLLDNEGRTPKDVQRHLAEFLGHRDAAIRAGVTRCLDRCTSELRRAEEMLEAALGVPEQKIRTAVASAVAKAIEPRFKPSQEVTLAIKGMSSPELEVRRQSAGVCAGYLIDATDCRSAAPHFAMALGDPDPQVRENAAPSLQYAFDMQGNLDVVRVTLPCIRAARATASGETVEHLDRALRDSGS